MDNDWGRNDLHKVVVALWGHNLHKVIVVSWMPNSRECLSYRLNQLKIEDRFDLYSVGQYFSSVKLLLSHFISYSRTEIVIKVVAILRPSQSRSSLVRLQRYHKVLRDIASTSVPPLHITLNWYQNDKYHPFRMTIVDTLMHAQNENDEFTCLIY